MRFRLQIACTLVSTLHGCWAHAQTYPYFPPGGMGYTQTPTPILTVGKPTVAGTITGPTPTSGTAPTLTLQTAAGVATNGNGGTLNFVSGNGTGSGNGGTVQFTSGNGGATGPGGLLTFQAGQGGATNGAGGELDITAGNGGGGATSGGPVVITGGTGGTTGTGGAINLVAGNGGFTSGSGGSIALVGGTLNGASGSGGSLTLQAGIGATTATNGTTTIMDPAGDNTLVIDQFGNIICACSSATNATDKFLYLGVSAGVPTGVPAHTTGVYANSVPARYDTTNNRLMIYNAGWQNVANTAQAQQTISFQPGLVSSVTNTKGGFTKFVKASTLDNLEVSATAFTCSVNPAITLFECATSTTCASPTTLASATITTAGTVVDGTVSATAINAGDYIAWAISAGTCTSLDIAGNAQVHSN